MVLTALLFFPSVRAEAVNDAVRFREQMAWLKDRYASGELGGPADEAGALAVVTSDRRAFETMAPNLEPWFRRFFTSRLLAYDIRVDRRISAGLYEIRLTVDQIVLGRLMAVPIEPSFLLKTGDYEFEATGDNRVAMRSIGVIDTTAADGFPVQAGVFELFHYPAAEADAEIQRDLKLLMALVRLGRVEGTAAAAVFEQLATLPERVVRDEGVKWSWVRTSARSMKVYHRTLLELGTVLERAGLEDRLVLPADTTHFPYAK